MCIKLRALPLTVSGSVDANTPGVYPLVYSATDFSHNTGTATRTVTVVDTTPPTVGAITAPVNPVPVNRLVTATAEFVENCGLKAAVWDWGDGASSSGTVNGMSIGGSHTYLLAGVYTLKLRLTDWAGNVGQSIFQYVVVYNPGGGFVTGGGWIDSPAGAYAPSPLLTGKATFGFVSKYEKGATVPTGDTQFNFHAADLDFHSTSYDWLVISGAKARYQGSGMINGTGAYGFLLIAIDGQVNGGGGADKFRIKIWNKNKGDVVYDNQLNSPDDADPTTTLGGGSIVIHKQ
jgi:Domain of unknown function (DUF5011)/PKD domain